jgi:hypothetical protein
MTMPESFFDPRRPPMRIAFVDHRDPTDPHNWSGVPSHMVETLADLQVISPVKTTRSIDEWQWLPMTNTKHG